MLTALVAVAALAVWRAWTAAPKPVQPDRPPAPDAERAVPEPPTKTALALAGLHQRKRAPLPGDWLARFDEPGQTFAEYKQRHPTPTPAQAALYLGRLGAFPAAQQDALAPLAELVGIFYAAPVKSVAPIALDAVPNGARRFRNGTIQLSSVYILEQVLPSRRPPDALAMLVLTASDLTPNDAWNYVFGQGEPQQRVGIWSVYRYGDPSQGARERDRFARRLFKIALHEIGHMLGLAHCTAYECLMNGANHLDELDRAPLLLCPECVQKVGHARGVDLVERYDSLARFADRHGLPDEATLFRASAAALRPRLQARDANTDAPTGARMAE